MAALTEDIVAGDYCATVAEVTVRKFVELDSEQVCLLPADTTVKVLEVVGRRLKVSAAAGGSAALEGWISSQTRLDEALVVKRVEVVRCCMEDPAVGRRYEVKTLLNLQVEPAVKSEIKAKLKPGTVVTVVELHPIDRYRVRISAPMVSGWISLVSLQGVPMACEATERTLGRDGVVFMPKYVKIKSLLEAAVSGDVEALRKTIEGKEGWFSSSPSKPDLNSADVRGKTSLMYAAGLGHRPAVEYLLSIQGIDVNVADETKKTALHHASKRGRQRRAGEHEMLQSEIVFMILNKRADIEARDRNGCTALMFAVANGDETVARRLILSDANVNVQDFEGHTPLDYAVNFAQTASVEMLRGAGAMMQAGAGSDDEAAGELPAEEAAANKNNKKAMLKDGAEGPEDVGPEGGKAPQGRKKKPEKAGTAKAAKKPSQRASMGMMEAISAPEMEDIVVERPEEGGGQATRATSSEAAACSSRQTRAGQLPRDQE